MGFEGEGAGVPRQHNHILDLSHIGRIYTIGVGAWVGKCQDWKVVLAQMEKEGDRLVEDLAPGEMGVGLEVEVEVEASIEEEERDKGKWRRGSTRGR